MTGSAASRVFLHVGTPKTGTTYLQGVMWRNRRELRRRGVHYPGYRPEAHFLAAMDLQGATAEEIGDPDLPLAWDRLVGQVEAARGTVVVSHELFSPMEPDRIERALDALGGHELHVVCTTRDLGRQLFAVWQEDLKNRHTLSFTEFLNAVRDPTKGHWLGRLFWRMQDVPDVLYRWASRLPPQRVHVVTVGPPGSAPEQLWQRFATVLGVGLNGLDASPTEPNSSLGLAEAQLLRRLNLALPPDLPWGLYEHAVRKHLVEVLAGRPSGARRFTVPPDQLPWVTERATQMMSELADAGYRVVGDLDDLIPTASTPQPGPDEVTDAAVLDAAVAVACTLVQSYGVYEQRTRSLRQRISELGARHAAVNRALAVYRSVRYSR
ncbi:MAG: hypothetical protein ACRDRR_07575 [Pseudonocardiaceae bacterium]